MDQQADLGDNKLILSSLKNGPLREEIERQGGIKLIYIDPPFDVGADFAVSFSTCFEGCRCEIAGVISTHRWLSNDVFWR